MTTNARIQERVPDGETLAWGGLVLTTEFIFVASYVIALDVTVTDWILYVVPFVWLNVGGWIFLKVRPVATSSRTRWIAGTLAVGYFVVLAYFGGLFGPNGTPVRSLNVAYTTLPPGWSPALLYNGSFLSMSLLPYKLVGYGALAYLVYVTAIEASNAILGGVLGLFSCVSCSFPIVASFLAGVAGSGTGLIAASSGSSVRMSVAFGSIQFGPFVISTVVFLVTVALLYWRPVVGSRWVGRMTPGTGQ